MANIGLSALASVLPVMAGLMSPVFGDPVGGAPGAPGQGIGPLPPGAGGIPPGMPPAAPGPPPPQGGPAPPTIGAGPGPGMPMAKDPRAITENDIQQVEAFMALLKHRIAAHRKTYLHSSSIGRYGQGGQ